MRNKRLSVLKNATEGCVTYYVGDNIDHVSHLKDCTLICKKGFSPDLPGVDFIHFENPQLEFYKLSERNDHGKFSETFFYPGKYTVGPNTKISDSASISPGVVIGKNVSIGDRVFIGPNTVIYDGVDIKEGTIIGANCCLGDSGILWVYDGDKKVHLEQSGGLIIEENCVIGSLVEICRGSANENTVIGKNTCIAHGANIGHGCIIGESVHMANGILLGGGCSIASNSFLGSGVIVAAGKKIKVENCVFGSGTVITRDIKEEGVYVGSPARRIRNKVDDKLSGVPELRRIFR